VLTVEMLPASYGMSLWLEWDDGTRRRRMLFDGGVWYTYPILWQRVLSLPASDRRFELVICSHVDGDHIDGLIRLFADYRALRLKVGVVWFNGWPQVAQMKTLGANQGEYLGALLTPLARSLTWSPEAVVVPDAGLPQPLTLAGGVTVTPLSPFRPQLVALHDEWTATLKDGEPGDTEAASARLSEAGQQRRYRGLGGRPTLGGEGEPGADALPRAVDNTVANASSIAVLVEQGKRSVLIGGDADPTVLATGVERLRRARSGRRRAMPPLSVDAFVLPHHGSRNNVNDALLSQVQAKRYLVSTDGRIYGHPHPEAIDAVLQHEKPRPGVPQLVFNYATSQTWPWADATREQQLGYQACFPSGVRIEV
jgi:glyoxylase-like metal-dependent hydrolase (beta-lactamase superfamily II)